MEERKTTPMNTDIPRNPIVEIFGFVFLIVPTTIMFVLWSILSWPFTALARLLFLPKPKETRE